MVNKIDHVYIQPTQEAWGKVYFTQNGKENHFIYEKKSGLVFNKDKTSTIRFKCFVLIFATPIITTIRMIYHVALVVVNPFHQGFLIIKGKVTLEKSYSEWKKSVSDVFRSCIYGCLMTGAAVKGFVSASPYNGRRDYGYYEAKLNRQLDLDVTNKLSGKKFYAAKCFQNLTRIINDRLESEILLSKHLYFLNKRIARLKMASFKSIPFADKKCRASSQKINQLTLKNISHHHIPSKNIIRAQEIQICLNRVLTPIQREEFKRVGKTHGLRITHNISYEHATKVCLGMSLSFLENYLNADIPGTAFDRMENSGKYLSEGATEKCLKNQALYEALLGEKGTVSKKEKRDFLRLLKCGKEFPCEGPSKQNLHQALIEFRKQQPNESLREFIIKYLEVNQMALTTDSYRLILFLDEMNSEENQTNSYRTKVTESLAESKGLKILSTRNFKGDDKEAMECLQRLPQGNYMIQMQSPANHTVVLIKDKDGTWALFDANTGTDICSNERLGRQMIQNRLKYYFGKKTINFSLFSIQRN